MQCWMFASYLCGVDPGEMHQLVVRNSPIQYGIDIDHTKWYFLSVSSVSHGSGTVTNT